MEATRAARARLPAEAAAPCRLRAVAAHSPLRAVLKKVQGLVFVGNSANAVVFYGLRVQGFQPACP